MGGCTAFNCNNSDKKGFRMFNYPTDIERRKRWSLNTRRDKFVPTKSSQLCEVINYFLSIFVFHLYILFMIIVYYYHLMSSINVYSYILKKVNLKKIVLMVGRN